MSSVSVAVCVCVCVCVWVCVHMWYVLGVNGIMFSGRQFLMCKSDVTYWHVANVGTQSRFLSVYFTGNLFQRDQVYESVLTLFPMSGEMVPVESELSGKI